MLVGGIARLVGRLWLAACTAWLSGCVDNVTPSPGQYSSTGPADSPDGSIEALPPGGAKLESRGYFASTVTPLLTRTRPAGACVSCHQGQEGPAFLGTNAVDIYQAVVTSDVLGQSAETSPFANVGLHTGDGLCQGAGDPTDDCQADERSIVIAWLYLELGI